MTRLSRPSSLVPPQECQNLALEHQFQHNFIEQDIIAIADTHSATDNTLSMQFYSRELDPLSPPSNSVNMVFFLANIALGTTSELITGKPSKSGRPCSLVRLIVSTRYTLDAKRVLQMNVVFRH
jgi:hypothetical protein